MNIHAIIARNRRCNMLKKLNYIFSAKDKVKMLFILFSVILGSFLELLGVAAFTPFVNVIMKPESIQEQWYLKYLYDILGFTTSNHFLAALAGDLLARRPLRAARSRRAAAYQVAFCSAGAGRSGVLS